MKSEIDRIQLGLNIRRERKKKNMTLEELASGLYSIGKMSNIENGATDISIDELKIIANKIGVPYKELLPAKDSNQEILQLLKEVELTQTIFSAKDALDLIQKIEQKHEEVLSNNSSLQMELNYLKGNAYQLAGNDLIASTMFYQVCDYPITSQNDVILHSKAKHKLGELYARNHQFRKAIENMIKAAENLIKHKLEVPWKIYYNLSILHLYQKKYEKASVYLTFIKRKNPKLSYVEILIHLLSGNYKDGIKNLDELKKDLIDIKDTETLIKSIMATLYFSSFSPTDYKIRTGTTIEFIQNNLSKKQLTDNKQISNLIIILQSIISNLLFSSDKEKVGHYLAMLIEFEERHNFMEHHHVSLLLKAIYTKTIDNTQPDQVDKILSEAQALMKTKGLKNSVLFAILYERALLNDDPNSFAFQALKMVPEYSNLDSLDIIKFEYFMPALLSI